MKIESRAVPTTTTRGCYWYSHFAAQSCAGRGLSFTLCELWNLLTWLHSSVCFKLIQNELMKHFNLFLTFYTYETIKLPHWWESSCGPSSSRCRVVVLQLQRAVTLSLWPSQKAFISADGRRGVTLFPPFWRCGAAPAPFLFLGRMKTSAIWSRGERSNLRLVMRLALPGGMQEGCVCVRTPASASWVSIKH